MISTRNTLHNESMGKAKLDAKDVKKPQAITWAAHKTVDSKANMMGAEMALRKAGKWQ